MSNETELLDDGLDINDDTYVFLEGPRFPNGEFVSEQYFARKYYEEVWRPRRIAFRAKLEVAGKLFQSIYAEGGEDCELKLKSMEEELDGMIFRHDPKSPDRVA